VTYRWAPNTRFVVTPGLRAERWDIVDRTSLSPWLLAEWEVAPATRVRGGIGVQRQAPGLDESLIVTPGDSLRPERARIADVGIERRAGDSWRVLATIFQRRESDRLRVVNSEFRVVNGGIFRPTTAYVDNVLDGHARGVEMTVERRALSGLTGWLSYAWTNARSTDVTTAESYSADYDQRHTVNANLAFRWSERSSLAVRYRFGSNFPLQGYLEPRGDVHVLTSERNVGRLPAYSRLDVRADRAFTYRRSRLTLFAEVVNVLNRDNMRTQGASLDLRTGQITGLTQKLFPILPSAGVLIEF
jgi:outer membrane receptor for ferrienterochelin and colicin